MAVEEMSNHGKPKFKHEPIEDRMYVLCFVQGYKRNWKSKTYPMYYTGSEPTRHMNKAKTFTLEKAKNTKQFATSAVRCEVRRVTHKMLFTAALKGT